MNDRTAKTSAIAILPTVVFDTPDAHRVEWTIGNQRFHIGPDYWDTEEEAKAFAGMFQHALDAYGAAVETPALLAACQHAETVMTLVEPRSHKAEYLETLAELRAALRGADEPAAPYCHDCMADHAPRSVSWCKAETPNEGRK